MSSTAKQALQNETILEDAPTTVEALFDRYFKSVWRFLNRKGVHGSDCDDAAQQVFEVLIKKGTSQITPGAERSFLFGTALRVASEFRKRQGRYVDDEQQVIGAADDKLGPEDLANQKQAHDLLERVLRLMNEDVRDVFVLYEIEEMTMLEIAATLELPSGTVASRLRRGREQFQNLVAERTQAATFEGNA